MKRNITIPDSEYKNWLKDLKEKVRIAQIRAAVKVNTELLKFYWELGADIVEKQKTTSWGDGFLKQLSKDLTSEFPEMKGFSRRNLNDMRRWYLCWTSNWRQAVAKLDSQFVQQLVALF